MSAVVVREDWGVTGRKGGSREAAGAETGLNFVTIVKPTKPPPGSARVLCPFSTLEIPHTPITSPSNAQQRHTEPQSKRQHPHKPISP